MRFRASIVFIPSADGGPVERPSGSGYAPDARPWSGERLPIVLHEIPEGLAAGQRVEVEIECRYPDRLDYRPLNQGAFELVMGPKIVGMGVRSSS